MFLSRTGQDVVESGGPQILFSVFAQTMTKVKVVVMMNFKGVEGVPRYAWQELAATFSVRLAL